MNLLENIKNKKTVVAIMGLGYVGLPLMANLIRKGFSVIGIDPDPRKIEALDARTSYIEAVTSAEISTWQKCWTKSIEDPKVLDARIFIVCVPTPLTEHYEPDLSYVENAASQIGTIARNTPEEILAILESTTYPGTTIELFGPTIEKNSGKSIAKDLFIAFAPEREDPGNKKFKSEDIPRVVGADDSYALACAAALYQELVPLVHQVTSTKVAEATKILENCYRLANISFVNELKMIFNRMGIDIWEVIAAAKTKPFGFTPFYPSGGIGGHCIAVDPFYLTWKAREFEIPTRFIELAGEINKQMPRYVTSQTSKALNSVEKPLKNSNILILGTAYKPNVGDLRESSALKIIPLLEQEGSIISYYDPYCPLMEFGGQDYVSAPELTPELLSSADCVLIITDHSCIDYSMVGSYAPLIVDTRNCIPKDSIAKVFKA